MNRMEIEDILKGIFQRHIYTDDMKLLDTFNEEVNLIADLNIDSLDVLNIVVDIENYFSIEIQNDEIRKMIYVKDCIDIIQLKFQVAHK
jgi:acyl carrier protein